MADVKKIINRITKDTNFKICDYKCNSSEVLNGDGSIDEKTRINIKFIYMSNPKADTPPLVEEIKEPLKAFGYNFSVPEFGKNYRFYKNIEKEVEMPIDWFSKVRKNGKYEVLVNKRNLIEKRLSETFDKIVEQEFNKIKSVIGGLPNLQKDSYYYYFFLSKLVSTKGYSIRVSLNAYPYRYDRESDKLKIDLKLEVYYNQNIE